MLSNAPTCRCSWERRQIKFSGSDVNQANVPQAKSETSFRKAGRERSLNAVEGRMQAAVSALPAGVRVLAAIHDPRLYVQGLEHMIDRPCIGRCFDYGNYEASTSQFRLRPEAGNFYVLADNGDIGALEHGKYVFWRKDLQVYKLFPCDEGKFCSAPLVPGELVASQQLNSLAARRD